MCSTTHGYKAIEFNLQQLSEPFGAEADRHLAEEHSASGRKALAICCIYETSKETNVVGRSSIIWINLLKLLELIFPEMLVLLLLCLMLSWNVGGYFTMLLIGFTIPIIGNIICDFNARKEIAKLNEEQHQRLVNDVANKIKETK